MKTILIIGFSRPNLLENCIKSVLNCNLHESFKKVIITQRGMIETKEVVDKYQKAFNVVLEIDGSDLETRENITRNRILGYSICFNNLKSDLCIALEEDVEISQDTLQFTNHIFNLYNEDSQFRGINFGSLIPYSDEAAHTYSKQRFGMNGPASAIPLKTWSQLVERNLITYRKEDLFDGMFEFYLKTGYMVTPNNSRYIDNGFVGSHTNSDPNSEFFLKIRGSYMKKNLPMNSIYNEMPMEQGWRKDQIIYRKMDTFYYFISYVLHKNRKKIWSRAVLFMGRKLKNK